MSNSLGAEGAKYISEGLAKNGALTSLKYAACRPFPYRQGPLTPLFDALSQFGLQRAESGGRKDHRQPSEDEHHPHKRQVRPLAPFSCRQVPLTRPFDSLLQLGAELSGS